MISHNQMLFSTRTQDELDPFDTLQSLLPVCEKYKCIGHHFDPSLGGMVYTFAESEEDIHQSVNKLLRKWEISLWPNETNWEAAFERAKKSLASVNEIIS
jgi:hypothetical protein